MPEIRNEVRNLADTMKTKFTPPDFVPGCEVQSIADISEYTTSNGWIEATVGPHNQQRVRYYGEPAGVQVGDFVDVEYFPNYRLYRVFGVSLGGTAATGGLRVDKIHDSNFGAVAGQTDASGNFTFNGTRTLTIPTDLIHAGDTDTKLSFTDDDIEFTAGGLSMLKLTEAAQDLITLGPGSGDVDINFNGDAFLRGSDGRLGINTAAPLAILHTAGSTTPLFVKETAQTSTPSNNTNFQHKTSGNMADGFGVFNVFTAMDNALVQNIIGSIGFIRDGADNEGAFIVKAGTNGLEEFMRITNTGEIGINGITSPSTELDIGAGAIEFEEMTTVAAGAANTARLFALDNGAGKTQLAVRFNSGAIQILATEP